MKLINKIALSLAAASTLFFAGCNDTNTPSKEITKKSISEESLGYRNVSLYDEKDATTPGVQYSTAAAGTSTKIKRAFQDAPPMIPHDTTGMLPIKKDNNMCITCHVDSAPYDKTIPAVPVSHMTNFRPASSYAVKGENTSSEEQKNVSIKKIDHLYQG